MRRSRRPGQESATSARTPAAAPAAGIRLSAGGAFVLNACFVAGLLVLSQLPLLQANTTVVHPKRQVCVTERLNAATEERLKTGHAVGALSIACLLTRAQVRASFSVSSPSHHRRRRWALVEIAAAISKAGWARSVRPRRGSVHGLFMHRAAGSSVAVGGSSCPSWAQSRRGPGSGRGSPWRPARRRERRPSPAWGDSS